MPRAAGERRAPDRKDAKALTPAQERVLVEILRAHPTPLRKPKLPGWQRRWCRPASSGGPAPMRRPHLRSRPTASTSRQGLARRA